MKKATLTVILMVVVVSAANAMEFAALKWADGECLPALGVGVAYYSENQREEDDGLAIYVQTPIVSWEYARIGLGGTFPIEYLDRSRPHFSLDFILIRSESIRLEIGPYVMASPYGGWGIHSGFSFRF